MLPWAFATDTFRACRALPALGNGPFPSHGPGPFPGPCPAARERRGRQDSRLVWLREQSMPLTARRLSRTSPVRSRPEGRCASFPLGDHTLAGAHRDRCLAHRFRPEGRFCVRIRTRIPKDRAGAEVPPERSPSCWSVARKWCPVPSPSRFAVPRRGARTMPVLGLATGRLQLVRVPEAAGPHRPKAMRSRRLVSPAADSPPRPERNGKSTRHSLRTRMGAPRTGDAISRRIPAPSAPRAARERASRTVAPIHPVCWLVDRPQARQTTSPSRTYGQSRSPLVDPKASEPTQAPGARLDSAQPVLGLPWTGSAISRRSGRAETGPKSVFGRLRPKSAAHPSSVRRSERRPQVAGFTGSG
jgi:hypothetical protein